MSVIKIVHELERVGDKAKRVSEMAIQLGGGNGKVTYYEIEHMAELVKSMLHDALDAFARLDLANLSQITERDENVDREYDNILRQLITRMMEDPRHITRALDVLWTVRALERIGDHACYICEHLIYIVKGEDVRHSTQHQLEEKINH
jgi:phosphate transport system protein